MCSSGPLSISATQPGDKGFKGRLNKVPAYAGIAAVDCYIGATEHVRMILE